MQNILLPRLKREIELRGPVLDVYVSCNRRAHSPLSVVIRWLVGDVIHVPAHEHGIENVKVSGFSKPPDLVLRLEYQWEHPEDVESLCTLTAWELGAGFLYRWMHAPAVDREVARIGVTASFAGCPYTSSLAGDMSHGDMSYDQVEEALDRGYWSWSFNGTYGVEMIDDSTSHGRFEKDRLRKWSQEPGAGSPRDADGCRRRTFPGWLDSELERIALEFETIDEPESHVLYIPRRFDTLRLDPNMR